MNKIYHVSNFISFLILILLIGGTAYYLYETRPCAQPIYYTIGTFDPQFGISQADFLADAQEAANLWNQEAGHTVLEYDNGTTTPFAKVMPVNLIFDNRQEESDVGQTITQQENELTSEKAQVAALQAQYDTAEQQFNSDKAAGKDADTLNAEADQLNQMGAQIQSEVTQVNANIAAVNANATAFNTQAGTDFEEGEFVEEYGQLHIDLYEFTDHTQLVRLMAHEFGHSLGLAHNTNPQSIMYPENSATTIALSTQDKAELYARCAVTFQNLNPFENVSLSSP